MSIPTENSNPRWEFLHRLSTLQTLLCALFGGPAVTFFLEGLLQAFSRPVLPWWGDLVVALFCSGGMVLAIALSPQSQTDATKSSRAKKLMTVIVGAVLLAGTFSAGRTYQKNLPPVTDKDLIAMSSAPEWGVDDNGTTVFMNVVVDKLGARASNYSMVLIAVIQDSSVDEMSDERIDRSNVFPLAVGARTIKLGFSPATITRLKSFPDTTIVAVNLYLLALPSQFTPSQITSLSAADKLGCKLMQHPSVGVPVARLKLP